MMVYVAMQLSLSTLKYRLDQLQNMTFKTQNSIM